MCRARPPEPRPTLVRFGTARGEVYLGGGRGLEDNEKKPRPMMLKSNTRLRTLSAYCLGVARAPLRWRFGWPLGWQSVAVLAAVLAVLASDSAMAMAFL